MRNQSPHVRHAQLWDVIQSSTEVLWTLKPKGNFKTSVEPAKTVETNRDRFNTPTGTFPEHRDSHSAAEDEYAIKY